MILPSTSTEGQPVHAMHKFSVKETARYCSTEPITSTLVKLGLT